MGRPSGSITSEDTAAGALRIPPQDHNRSPELFRREGEYWTIAYDRVVFRLRDTKGLHHLMQLLTQPGVRIPAGALLGDETRTLDPLNPEPLKNPGARDAESA